MIIKNDPEQFINYLSDASNYKGYADSIYFPENEAEISNLLKNFNKEKIKITVSGNGTGLTGGRVPEGGIIISLEKFNRILELNLEKKFVIVQPAVVLKDLQDFVEAQNLFYPPDPTERNCFIGATVATNASGARTFKYGSTRNYVLELRIVLPDGETIVIERGQYFANQYEANIKNESGKVISFKIPNYKMPKTKNAAGYYCKENMDLIDLFIGSEGTLGIISEIKLKLIDLPKKVLSCVAFFTKEENALSFIDEARELRQNNSPLPKARALEFFDVNALNFLLKDYPNIPKLSQAAVWFEEDYNTDNDDIIENWISLLKKYNCDGDSVWYAFDKIEQEKFHEFRHAISLKVNEFISQHNFKKVGTDVSVPVIHFRSFYYWMRETVEKENIDYVVYGHFGDCHPHLNMLPKNESEYLKSKEIYANICAEAVRLEGTISAEHGIGKLKRDYLKTMYGEDNILKMAKLKLVFDPNKILNVGNIFDEKYLDAANAR
ncbi:MAG: FAD-binding oxidoreductase [Melioribacteraceae bacterium]